MSIIDDISKIKSNFKSDLDLLNLKKINSDDIKYKYLGRKGLVSNLYSLLSSVDSSEKPIVGKKINQLKLDISNQLNSLSKTRKSDTRKSLDMDYSLPGIRYNQGSIHPLTLIIQEIKDIFNKIGFSNIYGSEVDTDYYNFEALNIPKHHPARDMQDTFYLNNQSLLRTHTSSSQVHFMENNNPPIRILSPGRVYRNEDISVRSYCLFHQIEGLYVDKNVTFSDLKGTLEYFAKQFFGPKTKIRFRPSYFPFTEPSAEMDVYWGLNSDSDYRITKGTGWLEILGCGMVNPRVFKSVDYDVKKWNGYAFGLGIERIAMLKYGIDDIRLLYEGNINFLGQFK
ncbi:phenylalanine--tRNA ligase subunit alpha [Candidatus Marinimicrobia bacterium]|nr:phenylalanine--tRNA ligase subunit alpha [Candidatus Neomarinimicrobiota bacterium]